MDKPDFCPIKKVLKNAFVTYSKDTIIPMLQTLHSPVPLLFLSNKIPKASMRGCQPRCWMGYPCKIKLPNCLISYLLTVFC